MNFEIVSSEECSIEQAVHQMRNVSMMDADAKLESILQNLESKRVRGSFIDLEIEKDLIEGELLSEDDKVLFAVKNVDVVDPDELTRYDLMALVVRGGLIQLFLYPKFGGQLRIEHSQSQNSMICYNNFSLLQMGGTLLRTRHSTPEEAQCLMQNLEDHIHEPQYWLTFVPNQDLEEARAFYEGSGLEITARHLNAMSALKTAHLEYRDGNGDEEKSDSQSSDDDRDKDNDEESETNEEEYIDFEMKRELLGMISESDKDIDVMDPEELTRYERLALVVRKGRLELFLYPKYGGDWRIEQSQAQNSMVCYDSYSLLSMRRKYFRTRHSTPDEAEIFQERFGANLVKPQYWLTFALEQDFDEAVKIWRDYGFDVHQRHITEILNLRNAYLEDGHDDDEEEEAEKTSDEDEVSEVSDSDGREYNSWSFESICKANKMIEYLQFLGEVMPVLREDVELNENKKQVRSLLSYLQFCLRTLPQHGNCRCYDAGILTEEEQNNNRSIHAQLDDSEDGDGARTLGWFSINRLLRKHLRNLENLCTLDAMFAASLQEFQRATDKVGLHGETVQIFEEKANAIHDELTGDELRVLNSRIPLGRAYSIEWKKSDCLSSLKKLTLKN